MSAANASRSSGVVIALPPYLTTTVAPWNRASHGSASMRVAALSWATARDALMSPPRFARSCRVRRVLVHVPVRQVVGADRRGAGTRVQVHRDGHGPGRQIHLAPVLGRGSPPTHPPAVDGDVERVGLEGGGRGTDGGQDP